MNHAFYSSLRTVYLFTMIVLTCMVLSCHIVFMTLKKTLIKLRVTFFFFFFFFCLITMSSSNASLNSARIEEKRNFVQAIVEGIFSYSIVLTQKVKGYGAGGIFRLVQIVILTYIICWELVLKKGYQSVDQVSSTVTTKVKGLGYINNSIELNKYNIYDTSDYVIPPNEYNSIFVMTNFIETEQTRGTCDEDLSKITAICTNQSKGYCSSANTNNWNGIPTGECIQSSKNSSIKVCEVNAWCPVEDDSNLRLDFTLELHSLLKRRNILPNITNAYIARCIYDPLEDPYCPVFQIGDILVQAESDENERAQMLKKGGVIQIEISWNCDYDYYAAQCQPKYAFFRFDLPFKQSQTASGFNFRFAVNQKDTSSDQINRTLTKAFGLRFIINVVGKAGQFNAIPLLLAIGSGLGLLSLSSLVADCYLQVKELKCKSKNKDNEKKYLFV